ncbi:uncharacterized protein LOC142765661 isoform X2 [Rhipicephalus microplus]|uniref:uncharacterized protein LOC142765661 isoform X2 n=1 Tax=Rhipicephalus microplus TaxID=6941 RepID=UPI003F6CC5B1
MSLNGTLLCLVQVFLGFVAFECAQPLYESCDDTSQLISKGPQFSTLSSPDDAVLLAFPFKHLSVTSSFGAAIKEHRHDFVFCGHGGPKAAMSLNGTLLCLVQCAAVGFLVCAATVDAEKSQQKRRHQCSYCDYTSDKFSHLTQHIRVHTVKRPFQYHFCPQSFKQKPPLNDHLRVHTASHPVPFIRMI